MIDEVKVALQTVWKELPQSTMVVANFIKCLSEAADGGQVKHLQ